MNVNIFGIGRSGSKLLFLLVLRILAEHNKTLKILYEPLYWKDMRCVKYNKILIRENLKIPILTDFYNYNIPALFRNLYMSEYPTIVKFTRMNTRLNFFLNAFPNFSSLVLIRDTYEILNSVAKTRFSLLYPHHHKRVIHRLAYPIMGYDPIISILQNSFEWEKLLKELKSNIPHLYKYILSLGNLSILKKDGVFIEIMNYFLLKAYENNRSKILRINFIDLFQEKTIISICSYLGLKYKKEYLNILSVNSNIIYKPNLFFNKQNYDENLYTDFNLSGLYNYYKHRDSPKIKVKDDLFDVKKIMNDISEILNNL